MQSSNFKLIKAEKPSKEALKAFIGKQLVMMDGTPVTVETIQGSMIKPTRFEVNHEHHIVILDAYKQLHKDKSITQDMIDAFDESVIESIEPVKEKGDISALKPVPKYVPNDEAPT